MPSFSRRTFFLLACLLLACFTSGQANADEVPIDQRDRRGLFVDSHLIDRRDHVALTLHAPTDEGPVFYFDKPWEGIHCGYCTVLRDGDRLRLYYRGMPAEVVDGTDGEVTCMAESADGIHWTRPELGLFPPPNGPAGDRRNNIVLAGSAPHSHNFSPFLDTNPACPPDQRYKALTGLDTSGLIAYTSPDGIRWQKLRDDPVIPRAAPFPFEWMFDSQNIAFWSESERKYVSYFRVYSGVRRIARCESEDFVHWTPPVLMQYETDGRTSPLEEIYTNQTTPYFRAPDVYLSFAARFVPGRQVISDEEANRLNLAAGFQKDVSDAILMSTRGGPVFQRQFLTSFVRPGIGARNWVSRTNYPALGIVQTGDTELSLYVNQDYAQPTAHLRRYSLRLDGFASARAPYEGGELLTKPMRVRGNRLHLNLSTSAVGSVRVEIQDAEGRPLPGYSADECREVIGNEIDRVVQWNHGSTLDGWNDRVIRLRFIMKDADLFSFRFD